MHFWVFFQLDLWVHLDQPIPVYVPFGYLMIKGSIEIEISNKFVHQLPVHICLFRPNTRVNLDQPIKGLPFGYLIRSNLVRKG